MVFCIYVENRSADYPNGDRVAWKPRRGRLTLDLASSLEPLTGWNWCAPTAATMISISRSTIGGRSMSQA